MNFKQLYETRDKIKAFLIRAEVASFSLGFKNVIDYFNYAFDNPQVLIEICPELKIKDNCPQYVKDNLRISLEKCRMDNFSIFDRNLDYRIKKDK